MSKLSVVIPVFNNEATIEKCILSLLTNKEDFEYIFIDDGSIDKSKNIICRYSKVDSRIKYYYKSNTGVSDSRNLGIAKSTAKLVTFVDADDYIENQCYDRILQEWDPSFSLYVFDYNVISSNNKIEGTLKLKNSIITFQSNNHRNDFIRELLNLEKNYSIGYSIWNKIFLKDIIINNNISFNNNLKIGEDLLFLLNYIYYANKIITSTNSFYNYVRYDTSVMNRKNTDFLPLYEDLATEIRVFLDTSAISIEQTSYLSTMIFHVISTKYFKEMNMKHKYAYLKLIANSYIVKQIRGYSDLKLKRRIIIKLLINRHIALVLLLIRTSEVIKKA